MRKLPLDETREQAAPRFWARVSKAPHPKGCWLWTGQQAGKGRYGRFQENGKREQAHRMAYALAIGPIPDGIFVLHRCDVPLCCNPTHLFLGTNRDNMVDMVQKGRLVGNRHLSDDQVRQLRRDYWDARGSRGRIPNGWHQAKSKALGVAVGTVRRAVAVTLSGSFRWLH